MSSFLWVEDFEAGNSRKIESCAEFAFQVFGRSLGLNLKDFPNSENELCFFLKSYNIYLATSYVEARKFISSRLIEVDSIVLDIDLKLCGEDLEEALPILNPIFRKWYGLSVEDDSDEYEEYFNKARTEMRLIAGYHLYTELVIDRGFPKDRIHFCSNHGEQLLSVRRSFEQAKIEAPEIVKKSDPRIGEWANQQLENKYIWLRRWIFIACRDLLDRMERSQILTQNANGNQLQDPEALKILLKSLPKFLPRDGPETTFEKAALLQTFSRTLTFAWEATGPWGGYFVNGKLEAAYFAVIKQARNFLSHDSNAMINISEGDVAFFFLITMRCYFQLSSKDLETYEHALLLLVGGRGNVPNEITVQRDFSNSYDSVRTDYLKVNPSPDKFFDGMVSQLQLNKAIPCDQQIIRLRQLYWHKLCWADPSGNYDLVRSRAGDPGFPMELSFHLYGCSF